LEGVVGWGGKRFLHLCAPATQRALSRRSPPTSDAAGAAGSS